MSADRDVLHELQAELTAITPSPAFPARVRARIDETPAAGRLPVWIGLAAGVTMAAVLAVVSPKDPPVPSAVVAEAPVVQGPAPAGVASRTAGSAPATASRPEPVRRAAVRVSPPRPAATPRDPFLSVVTDQGAVLDELWRIANARAGASPVVAAELPATAVSVDADGLMIVPELVVDPIVVPPIGAPAGGQGRIHRVTSPQATGSPR